MNKDNTTPPPKKFTFDRNAKGVSEMLGMKYETMAFDGAWRDAFGTPERRGVWIIWGNSGNGKTSFALQLAKYLCRFGRVAYDSLEEGACLTMQEAMRRENMMEVNKKFLLIDNENMEELGIRLSRQKSPDIVVIDSFQYTQMNYRQYIAFKERHKRKLLIFGILERTFHRTDRSHRHSSRQGPYLLGRRITFNDIRMKTTMKIRKITPQQIKALHAQFRRMGFNDEDRHGFISQFTEGRTDSTAGLTKEEAGLLLTRLNREETDRLRKEARSLVKQIFSLSFRISFLNKDFPNDTPEDFEMNKAKINVFCRTRSKFRKPITEMTLEELKEVKRQFEALARKEDTIKQG